MADPVRFVGANQLLKGDGDTVLDLQVRRNGDVVWSCWEFSDEELLEVIRTRRAWIGQLAGSAAPMPVRLTAKSREVFPDERDELTRPTPEMMRTLADKPPQDEG